MNSTHVAVLALFLIIILYIFFGENQECNSDKNKLLEHAAPVSWKGSDWGNVLLEYPDYPIVVPTDSWLARNHMLPWWNSTRHTKNMSWDIRGDVMPTVYDTGPFYRSPHIGYRHY